MADSLRPARKKILKITLIIIGVVFLLLVGLNIWFIRNAKGLLIETVHTKSKGKFKMDLSEVTFDFFSNKIKIRKADLISTDSISTPTTYHVQFSKLTLRVHSFWSLILRRELKLDSIKLHNPVIEVIRWRKDTLAPKNKDNLSITQEMGKLYNSMLDALDGFGIRRIIINNAQLSLIDKINKDTEPVTISKIYLDLLRSPSTKKRDEYIPNEQTIDLNTSDQNIALPGGRHRLAFKNFHLGLFQKKIVMDSCTITALQNNSSKSSYSIFFKRLSLVGVDFDAMYGKNLIKADSVYCENPLFNIHLKTTAGTGSKKEQPNPDKIIQELTGDLDLAFIGVKDAGIHINITGKKNRSLFNSNQDDFEMRGLRINADSAKPVVVKQFDMLVRDYRLYNEDSSAAYTFDSIRFQNNRILLSNFSVTTTPNKALQHNFRDFKIPYFALTGLNWYKLVFDQNMEAEEAFLYNPNIQFVSNRRLQQKKKKGFFSALANLDDLVALKKISIINGQLDVRLSPTMAFDLRNVNLSLHSDRLLRSTTKESLRRAIDLLSFSNGRIRLKENIVTVQHLKYTANNLVEAQSLKIAGRYINAAFDQVRINDLLVDNDAENMVVSGMHWQSARIAVAAPEKKKSNSSKGMISLQNISGGNTSFSYSNKKNKIETTISSFRLGNFSKEENNAPRIDGLLVDGKKLSLKGTLNVSTAAYKLRDKDESFFENFSLYRFLNKDSFSVQAPSLRFSIDINSLLAKDLSVNELVLNNPDIQYKKWSVAKPATTEQSFPFSIKRLLLVQPSLYLALHESDSVATVIMPFDKNNEIEARDIRSGSEGFAIGTLTAKASSALYTKKSGEQIGVEKGKVDLRVSQIHLQKTDGKTNWNALVDQLDLEHPKDFSLGKKNNQLSMQKASMGNIRLSSAYLGNVDQLIKFNVSAWLRTATGSYQDSLTTLRWYNAGYDQATKTLRLDSFHFRPTQSRDSAIAKATHQINYTTLKTGVIELQGFNLDQYKKDSAFIAHTLTVNDAIITSYRDKQPPFLAGVIKPLPTDLIKNLKIPIRLNRVNLVNGTVLYSEKHAKTRAEGTLQLTQLNAQLQNIKNHGLTDTDSLLLNATAFLMDSAEFSLRIKESYKDSLSGFLMTLRMKPTTLAFLNPVLAPLSNVIITSGTIDSLQMRAIGKESLSLGQMQMFYHDLKIKLVKNGDVEQTTFGTRLLSFLANAILIHKKNNGRIGLVYFERLRDRSFFNYLVKMTFSGMATSIGVVSNKKYLKRYKRELQQRKLPPIGFE